MSNQQSRSYDWWLHSPQEHWPGKDREEILMNTRRNRSLSNTNDISEEEEVTETIQRTRKIIRGSRKNRAILESETQLKWQLSEDQQKEAYSRLLFSGS